MPCRMDDMPCEPDFTQDPAWKNLKKEADKATKHLCTVLSLLEERPIVIAELPADIQRWWKQHAVIDQKRLKREKIEADIRKLQKELESIK